MTGGKPLIATPAQTVGPFFHFGLTREPRGRMVDAAPEGEMLRLSIRVFDGETQPVNDAMVELWHDGAFGRMPTGADGACEFEMRAPRPKQNPPQLPHTNVCLFARGLLRHVFTRMYFAHPAQLADDPVLALVAEDRRRTLLAEQDGSDPGRWTFEIHLQGTRETVFFDL
ncbi:MAG TPA: hypothetical protein VM364_20655 [Vicinamibacterales bacterium]|nr:hypothetical protein [Vicinamibacterales bacterium]